MRQVSAFVLVMMAAFGLLTPASAQTQPYPSRPITLVVPFAAGGPLDVLARLLSERMRTSLGQLLIVETISGAAGIVGISRVARAAPDGYTVSVGNWGSHVASPALYPTPFDVLGDFEPVSLIANVPIWLIARASIPANNLQELIAWLKANPDKATAATVGQGNATHLCGIDFQNKTGVRFQFATYRGAGPAVQDLVAGQVDLMFGEVSTALPHVKAGTIKAHAVLAPSRWFAAPDVPTIDEAGVPGLHVALWFGMWLPKATPPAVIATFERATRETLADPAVRQRVTAMGLEIPAVERLGPAALGALQRAEIDKWWPIIKAAKIKVE